MKLGDPFYLRDDVLAVSRDLLGKVLCTVIGGEVACAMITETEAYAGVDDRASHAYGNRRTRRTEPMFRRGGIAYVYLCYGIHHLFNVVTAGADTPAPTRSCRTGSSGITRHLLQGVYPCAENGMLDCGTIAARVGCSGKG